MASRVQGQTLCPTITSSSKPLDHHQREGFLNQKLTEPRSYDYDRMRVWDDRLRMPQFRFSRKCRQGHRRREGLHARGRKRRPARR